MYDFKQRNHQNIQNHAKNQDSRAFPFSPNLNSVLPLGLQFQGFNPNALENAVLRLMTCASQLDGFTDKDLGAFNLDPSIYCTPQTTRFIPEITCCAPQPPERIPPRLLFFQPGTLQVTELDLRAKGRPRILSNQGKVVYLIHGYLDSVTDSVWIRPVARAWNDRGANVIADDWRFGSVYYFQSLANASVTGSKS